MSPRCPPAPCPAPADVHNSTINRDSQGRRRGLSGAVVQLGRFGATARVVRILGGAAPPLQNKRAFHCIPLFTAGLCQSQLCGLPTRCPPAPAPATAMQSGSSGTAIHRHWTRPPAQAPRPSVPDPNLSPTMPPPSTPERERSQREDREMACSDLIPHTPSCTSFEIRA